MHMFTMVACRSSSIKMIVKDVRPFGVLRAEICSSQELQSLPNLILSKCRKRTHKNVDFVTPNQGGNYIAVKSVNLIYIFKTLLFYSRVQIEKTDDKVSMNALPKL